MKHTAKRYVSPRVYDDLPAGPAFELMALETRICEIVAGLDEKMPTWRTEPMFAEEREILRIFEESMRKLSECVGRCRGVGPLDRAPRLARIT